MIGDAGWKEYYKKGEYQGFTLKAEGGLCTKSCGIIPCSPIEVGS